MMVTGTRQRLCCGAWLLAAVLLAVLNVFPLMSMEARPTVGYSRTIRELQTNLQKLDTFIDVHGLPLHARWALPEFFTPSPAAGNSPAGRPTTRVPADLRNQAPEPTPLPALSGIIQTLDPNGSVYLQAVLGGRGYREKDKLDNFTVDQITPAGVVLRHSERTWFIKCPTPFYSSDQGE